MSSMKIIKTVEKILRDNPETRDNDRILILKVWNSQIAGLDQMAFWGFADRYLKGSFTDTESIRRTRQKLQELKPELRGKNFRLRHDVLAPDFKAELKNI